LIVISDLSPIKRLRYDSTAKTGCCLFEESTQFTFLPVTPGEYVILPSSG
jgi:hypothetical protein